MLDVICFGNCPKVSWGMVEILFFVFTWLPAVPVWMLSNLPSFFSILDGSMLAACSANNDSFSEYRTKNLYLKGGKCVSRETENRITLTITPERQRLMILGNKEKPGGTASSATWLSVKYCPCITFYLQTKRCLWHSSGLWTELQVETIAVSVPLPVKSSSQPSKTCRRTRYPLWGILSTGKYSRHQMYCSLSLGTRISEWQCTSYGPYLVVLEPMEKRWSFESPFRQPFYYLADCVASW